MAKLIIDGNELEVPDHYTVLQACEDAGAEIPRFCFHERLSIAGNCRMCLVEVKGGPPKPQASCALGVRDLRPGPNGEPPVVETRSPMVKKAREGVMEFLLINHPLDCPICDQGGECDLQDQAMAYGIDKNRFAENKRAVEDKYIGPLVRTKMTRCIHCTRCVRFTTEVAGISELGLIGRGEDAEITTYLESAMTSEMQGNVIDLCPVGALTSRPYQDTARPWELRKIESIDVMDAVGSSIRVDARGKEVMRVMPRLHDDVNEEWISDKSRFIWDGLKVQRLDRPYIRVAGKLKPASWNEAFNAIAKKVKSTPAAKMGAIGGALSGVEELFALKSLVNALGSENTDCRPVNSVLDPKLGRESYVFNASIAGIEQSDALLLIGSNPRYEAAVLNSRILKRVKASDYPVGVIGDVGDLRYKFEALGNSAKSLKELVAGKNRFLQTLKKAKRPLIIIGQGALSRSDSKAILSLAAQLAKDTNAVTKDWNGLSFLHTDAGLVGGLDIGFVPGAKCSDTASMVKSMELLFLHSVDEIDLSASKAFKIYIGTHGDSGAHVADVILPAATYTEKSATYVNTEGRVQASNRAAFAPGDAKEDWAIFRALSATLGKTLEFNSLTELRSKLYSEFPHLARLDEVVEGGVDDVNAFLSQFNPSKTASVTGTALTSPIQDYFMTNPIARASKVMAECSKMRSGAVQQAAE
ncbi:MAG: NADH-quinone oxidoreductase subunit NuoG [Pseudomonadota bacterium]